MIVHLDERCFEAEGYYNDCGLEFTTETQDIRINYGRWVLTNLLVNFTSAVYLNRIRDSVLEQARNTMSPSTSLNTSNITNQEQNSISQKTPTRSQKLASTPSPMNSLARQIPDSTTPTYPISDSPSASPGIIDRIKGNIHLRLPWSKKTKKQVFEDSEFADEDEYDDQVLLKPLFYTSNSIENLDKYSRDIKKNAMIEIIPHWNEEETPFFNVSNTISLSQQEPESCGFVTIYKSNVENISSLSQVNRLKEVLPAWIYDPIIENKKTAVDVVKIGFSLTSIDKTRELPNNSSRLSANRMLRIKKLKVYICEKCFDDEILDESGDERAKRLVEITCQGVVVGDDVTLAMLRYLWWKGNGELTLNYSRKSG